MNEKPSVNAPSNLQVMYRNIMIANLLVLLGNLVLTSLSMLSPSVQQRPQLVMVARCVCYKPSDPSPYDTFLCHKEYRVFRRRGKTKMRISSVPGIVYYYHPLCSCALSASREKIHIHGEILTSLVQILPRESKQNNRGINGNHFIKGVQVD